MHFCPAIIGWFLLPRARFPKWAVAPFEATWALWAAPILHRFSSAHLVNLRCVKLKIEISVGKWVGVVFGWRRNQSETNQYVFGRKRFLFTPFWHSGTLWILSSIFWPALIMRNFSSGSENTWVQCSWPASRSRGCGTWFMHSAYCIVHSDKWIVHSA